MSALAHSMTRPRGQASSVTARPLQPGPVELISRADDGIVVLRLVSLAQDEP